MNSGWEQAKLRALEAKTERQLRTLVERELLSALQSDVAANRAHLKRVYTEASRLLSILRELTPQQRLRLESQLAELRERLLEGSYAVSARAS